MQNNLPQDLFDRFVKPPEESKPFVRWWWNGNSLDRSEIVRELDLLKASGVGGVEINPIAMPPHEGDVPKGLVWLSPEWNQMLAFALREMARRGMIADVIIGTGWPFGGEFIRPEETNQRMVVVKREVEGPITLSLPLPDLMAEAEIEESALAVEPELRFVRMAPENASAIDDCIDVPVPAGKVETLEVTVPAGRYVVHIGLWYRGTRTVANGAPGGRGPVMDHYDAEVVAAYLNRMSDRLGPYLPGGMGHYIRAMFCDSMELAGANWTDDLPEQFSQRRGYDLTPYLPFVFHGRYSGYEKPLGQEPFGDCIRRARYDFNRTLLELYMERFVKQVREWCHKQGVQFRYQAYGAPWLMDMPAGYMVPDIPESNNWLFSKGGPYKHGYWTWNEYTASGGHLAGRKIISTEAMTNVSGVFRTELADIKQADDENFVMGINHSVLHGYNYSPPEAGFPGWVRYGTYFSEQNPWWPYFAQWTRYNARLSAVFQAADHVPQCAVLAPLADLEAEVGLWRTPFQTQKAHRLWEPLQRNGYAVDYLHEEMVKNCHTESGALTYGSMRFPVVFLVGARSIRKATADVLARFVAGGGKLVFVDDTPSRGLSMCERGDVDQQVATQMADLLKTYGESCVQVASPEEENFSDTWVHDVLKQLSVEPLVEIEQSHEATFVRAYQYDKSHLLFFANTSRKQASRFGAVCRCDDGTPWLWDPHSGRRCLLAHDEETGRFEIELDPLESALVVMEPEPLTEGPQEETALQVPGTAQAATVSGRWQGTFVPVQGAGFTAEFDGLPNLGSSADSRLNAFAGKVAFDAEIEVDDDEYDFLDLGMVDGVTEVVLNGCSLGSRWYGRHLYRLNRTLKRGRNHVRIMLTTVLANYMRTCTDNPTIKPWVTKWRQQGPFSVGFNDSCRLLKS